VEVVASLSRGRTAAAQCGLFTHKSVPVIFEPPCTYINFLLPSQIGMGHDPGALHNQFKTSLYSAYFIRRCVNPA